MGANMPVTVRLKDIIEALEMQVDEYSSFLDLDTGKVEHVSHSLLNDAEEFEEEDESPDLPEWQLPEWEAAKKIVFSDRFEKLPTKHDIHEWDIMRRFAEEVDSEESRDDLLFVIHGAGAFRNFRHALKRHSIEKDWYAFRDEALRDIAIEWCEENEIPWQ